MSGLAGWFWLRLPHELAVRMRGQLSSEGLKGLECVLPKLLTHVAGGLGSTHMHFSGGGLLECPHDVAAAFSKASESRESKAEAMVTFRT